MEITGRRLDAGRQDVDCDGLAARGGGRGGLGALEDLEEKGDIRVRG